MAERKVLFNLFLVHAVDWTRLARKILALVHIFLLGCDFVLDFVVKQISFRRAIL